MADQDQGAERADVVVVGSGFGGAVAAYRFARAGRDVVLLERGRPYPPGAFPRTPSGLARGVWDPSQGLHGMFDLWTFRRIDAVVSSGLGGGSLIYANVLLRKDEQWFAQAAPLPGGGFERWPLTRADLEPHYAEAERMIGIQTYPRDVEPYASTPKTAALAQAAASLGLDWHPVPLAVSFAPSVGGVPVAGAPIPQAPYGSLFGLPRRTCRLCGECDLGCNDGAKNSLDHTYLAAAQHHGADLRSRHEVRSVAARPEGGYTVRYVVHGDPGTGGPRDTRAFPERVLICRQLVLAAGALGTTWLLLRSRSGLPGLGPALGSRFSGNGDLLGFVLRARSPDGTPRPLRASFGPVITSAVRIPDALDSPAARGGEHPAHGRGYYVEDAGYPGFVDWLVESAQWPGTVQRALVFAVARLQALLGRTPPGAVDAQLSALLGRGEVSDAALPLLGMGRDVPDGVLRLRRGWLDAGWAPGTSAAYFSAVRATMRALAGAMGGEFADNPLRLFRKVVTVHPLGGAPMAVDPAHGVVSPFGEAFGHPGLFVADGAAMPGPVGPNPALTIAALADRMSSRALGE